MEKHRNTGFLFDLDGVLIDSEKEYSRIWSQINNEFPTGIESLEEKIKGTTLDKILSDYFPDHEIQQSVKERLYEMESRMKYETKEGVAELLEGIKNRNKKMALVTSSNDDKMRHLEEEIPGFIDLFDHVVTSDQISRSKPDPEGYILGARKIGCEPKNCVVFEDSVQGIKAGMASGAYVIGIAGTLPGEKLQPYSHRVIETLIDFDIDAIIEILENR